MISVYTRTTDNELTIRKLETIDKYNEIIQYGRMNPIWFIENIFKIELLDYQKWLIDGSWATERAVWVCSRNAGKTFIGATFIMAKSVLFPSFETYLMSVTGSQSKGIFTKIENIAKRNIASLTNSSLVFWDEIVKSNANSDGFTHGSQSFECKLFNGSSIKSLVGVPKNIVGYRSNLNVYDESGKIGKDFFTLTEPFTTQDTNFMTGTNIDLSVIPRVIPTQCLYMSSAEDINSYLYEVYKDCARGMMMGRKDVFVADINCEIPLNPTLKGKPYPPLFKRSEVDNALRNNEYRALREYYNLFDTTGGSDSIISHDIVMRNEKLFLPEFSNDGTGAHYGIFFDPAAVTDNSVILVAKYWKDSKVGWKARFVNCLNLIEEKNNKEKRLLTTVEQLQVLKEIILAYNGNAPDYQNIYLFIDPGSGGGGRYVSDQLMLDYNDKFGLPHRGLIDENDDRDKLELSKFPHAIRGVKELLTAIKYKNEMFAAFQDLTSLDLIEFPVPLPPNGILDFDDKEHKLTKEEMKVFLEMDLLKEEAYNIRKTKTEAGNIKYGLPADKQKRMHDDRIYVAAAAAYHLLKLRNKEQFDVAAPKNDFSKLLGTMGPRASARPTKASQNPFASTTNPFKRG